MNIVVVELRNEILAAENPEKVSVDDLNAKYPKGTIFVSQDTGASWYVVNRGSPVLNMKFSSRPRAIEYPNNLLPEIVRLAAMIAN